MKDFKYELSLKWHTCFANLSCSIRTHQDLGLCIDFIYLSQQMCKKEDWCVSSCKHWIFEAYLDSASKGNEGNLEVGRDRGQFLSFSYCIYIITTCEVYVAASVVMKWMCVNTIKPMPLASPHFHLYKFTTVIYRNRTGLGNFLLSNTVNGTRWDKLNDQNTTNI